ncbi:MAG: hypothetical protein JW791_03435 [Nanoarchaeota archaeon]|nr:hypothetical protein [Nanoarchaeota archaeon]
MSIEELFKDKSIQEVIVSLQETAEELKNLTNPIKLTMNPKMKSEDELFQKVKELRIEVEELAKKVEDNKSGRNLKVIKDITEKVKKIVSEKQKIQEELRLLRASN